MVKLTPDLIEQAAQYTNPVRDRELDLRGYKIPVIENMGATLDQFDTIELSDNEIRKLDGFPLLKRLKNILLNNNRLVRIGEHLEESLPNLESLILTNNSLQELGDIDNLSTCSHLKCLSLLRNPLATKQHYRLYVIHKIPTLTLLDFKKVRDGERSAANNMFKGKKGQKLAADLGKRTKVFTPGAAVDKPASTGVPAPPAPDQEAIKAAIQNTSSLDEIERLQAMLQAGQIPGRQNGHQTDFSEMEM